MYTRSLPSVNTNFMTLIVGFLENLGPSKNLLADNKESDFDVNSLQVGQEFTSDFIWSIIEAL